TISSKVGSRDSPLRLRLSLIIEIIELFWSIATMVRVPLGLLMRWRPRSLPGVKPRPKRRVTLWVRRRSDMVRALPFVNDPVRTLEGEPHYNRGGRGCKQEPELSCWAGRGQPPDGIPETIVRKTRFPGCLAFVHA